MPVFEYKALNPQNKTIVGLVEASSENAAVDVLREKELDVISLIETKKSISASWSPFDRIKVKDVVIFSRQFSVLISASVTLVQTLKILVEQTTNKKLRIVISEIASEVDGGARLSDSLAKYPKVFSNFYVNVVKSGETSGKLDEVLDYLADELEKDYDMTSKIRGAMIYPAFVLCSLIGVGILMMIFVIPKMMGMLTETGTELPIATKILIAISEILVGYWWLLLIIIIGLIAGIRMALNVPAGKRLYDNVKLRLPILGTLFQRIYLVRFSRSMQTLIVGGVSISKALTIAAEVIDNSVYKDLIEETKKEVEDGNSISVVFIKSKEVPKMVSQMLSIGERSGKLDSILGCITDFYMREINNIVANLMTLMEPIIMVIMGVGVGIMIAAIILPMYNMAAQL